MSIPHVEVSDLVTLAQSALSAVEPSSLSQSESVAYASAQALTALALSNMQVVDVQRQIYGMLGDLTTLIVGQRAQLVRIADVLESADK